VQAHGWARSQHGHGTEWRPHPPGDGRCFGNLLSRTSQGVAGRPARAHWNALADSDRRVWGGPRAFAAPRRARPRVNQARRCPTPPARPELTPIGDGRPCTTTSRALPTRSPSLAGGPAGAVSAVTRDRRRAWSSANSAQFPPPRGPRTKSSGGPADRLAPASSPVRSRRGNDMGIPVGGRPGCRTASGPHDGRVSGVRRDRDNEIPAAPAGSNERDRRLSRRTDLPACA
jgi:hypothetical protein